ncbi:MAG: hypothetical protein ACREH9_12385, partial [Pseudomonadota bacterium]
FQGMDALTSKARDRVGLEARRREGARLLQRRVRPPEVARRLKFSRTSFWRWGRALAANGRGALRKAPRTGRPPRLTGAGKKQLAEALEARALAQGYATGPVDAGARGTSPQSVTAIASLIAKISGKRYSESGAARRLKGLNFSCQRPSGRASA